MNKALSTDELNIKKYGRSNNIHVVNEIVEPGLCVRCGACEPSCPEKIIKFDEQAYPYITDEEKCLFGCIRCLKICPGEVVDFEALDKKMFGVSPSHKSVTGIIRRHLITYSTDTELRKASTSGGFVTQLLTYLLESKFIDGALVLGSESGSDGWVEKPFIARSKEDLRSAIKSKYRLVPYLRVLEEIEKIDGNYAIVGLPCHLHAIHKYIKATKKLQKRIKLLIGLYCNVAFEPRVLDELCETNGLARSDIKHLDFRAGHWPGTIIATLQNDVKAKVLKVDEMRDEFNLLKLFYAPSRCNMCIDFSAEYADIAVGDPWLRDRPDGEFIYPDGWTGIVTRTELGDKIVKEAEEAGVIHTEESSVRTFMVNWERAAKYKREFVPNNINIHKMLGHKTPKYYRKLPKTSLKSKIKAMVKYVSYKFAENKMYRMLGLKIFQSKMAIYYFRANRGNKAAAFLKDLPKMEKFYEENRPPLPKASDELDGNVRFRED